MLTLVILILMNTGCNQESELPEIRISPTQTVTKTTIPPSATFLPPTQTTTLTNTPLPPTATETQFVPTFTPLPPTQTPLPTTDTVCTAGCDFNSIQAAIDNGSTTEGAVIELLDPIHTECGIVVNKDVTIRGLGAQDTIVQAHAVQSEALDRVFYIKKNTTVSIENMTIRNGKPSEQNDTGGGIRNFGILTIRNSIITENTANGGGGISNSGTLTLINSTISFNVAHGDAPIGDECGNGGGIKCGSGRLIILNSTIHDNLAGTTGRNRGGGIHVGCGCSAEFINTTISNNKAIHSSGRTFGGGQGIGGGVYVAGELILDHCTIAENSASSKTGGVFVCGKLAMINTIIANNSGRGDECSITADGTIGENNFNLVGGGSCNASFSDDPLLGPLADNGGETLTHALLPGSPAIDVIPLLYCTQQLDQRWLKRPVIQSSSETPCDIGAFEVQSN